MPLKNKYYILAGNASSPPPPLLQNPMSPYGGNCLVFILQYCSGICRDLGISQISWEPFKNKYSI